MAHSVAPAEAQFPSRVRKLACATRALPRRRVRFGVAPDVVRSYYGEPKNRHSGARCVVPR